MCCTPQRSLNKKHAKKVIAIAFLVCFIVVSLLSETFILTRANHAHDHNGAGGTCATCAQIQSVENLIKQLNTVAVGVCFSLTGLFAISVVIKAIYSNIAIITPTALKIRLNI